MKSKIAILGSRGIPACYGGYETLVEELSVGMAAKGDTEVLVYCRSGYFKNKPKIYRGVDLVYLPSIPLKAIESTSLAKPKRKIIHMKIRAIKDNISFNSSHGHMTRET